MADGLTIRDVMKELGVEADHKAATSIGLRATALYETMFGAPPEKDLRPKTAGGGTHCFAIYPPAFKPHLVAIIQSDRVEDARQGRLF